MAVASAIPAAGDVVLDDTGRRLTLLRLVKSGGAGSVFLLKEASDLVAKIYHRNVDHATYARKLDAMLRLSPDLPDILEGANRRVQIAWPTACLRDARGRFVGFLMPSVDVRATSELELVLQDKQARAAGLPTGLGAKATLAANLSAVVAALHAQRHYIVDLKPVNLRFYRDSLHMAMLDCDGFSIQGSSERFPAPQFTPDYLAPEFQKSGITAEGEQAQDRFALAVVVFQLLNFGIHPFTGRPLFNAVPSDVPGRIAGKWYAYGVHANAGMAPNPGSGHSRMPAELRALFDQAFQSQGLARPSADEWQALLASYGRRSTRRLVPCQRDATHQHYAGQICAQCERTQLLQQARAVRPTVANGMRRVLRTTGIVRPRHPARVAPPARTRLPPMLVYVPTHPMPSAWRRAGRKLLDRIIATVVVLALMGAWTLIKEALSPRKAASASHQVEAPVYPRPTPISPPLDRGEYVPPLDAVVGSVLWIEADLANAGDYRDQLQQRVMGIRARAAKKPPPKAETLKAFRIAMAAHAPIPGDESDQRAARAALRRTLVDLLRRDRWAGDIAFELGHLALVDGDLEAAERSFTHAIAVAPADPAGWYGLAATKPAVEEEYGALSLAEMVADDAAKAQALRERFTPEILEVAGINPDRFAVVSARARMRAARMGGMPVPYDVELTAARRLP